MLFSGSTAPANGSSTVLVRKGKSEKYLVSQYYMYSSSSESSELPVSLIFIVFDICLLQDSSEKAERYNNLARVEFQEGRYENACQQYTSALGCLSGDHEKDRRVKYLCNRAACFVKLVCCSFQLMPVYFLFEIEEIGVRGVYVHDGLEI